MVFTVSQTGCCRHPVPAESSIYTALAPLTYQMKAEHTLGIHVNFFLTLLVYAKHMRSIFYEKSVQGVDPSHPDADAR